MNYKRKKQKEKEDEFYDSFETILEKTSIRQGRLLKLISHLSFLNYWLSADQVQNPMLYKQNMRACWKLWRIIVKLVLNERVSR